MAQASRFPYPFLRQEVQNYVRASERLISSVMMPGSTPLSEDERQIVKYYMVEISQASAATPEAAESWHDQSQIKLPFHSA